ncbi:3'-5' exonuclease [Pelovirga terrestris]|uniref:DNA polymerase III subunit epsilon n=1 Tax=Pelovirga terrestris TaxID=2771352 RepID=A0A8J6QVY2_9BACT|nr:exonuclease domain-containing protein [Pelovirga terrestris]MBD1399366.1 DNA polymerase III subunit epsilon [Pelovirga terrestris]
MKPSFKYWIFLVAIYFAVISIMAASLIGSWASINESQQLALQEMLPKLVPFPLLGSITILFIIGALINLLFNDYIMPILKMAESSRIITTVNPEHRIELKAASKEIEYLAKIINQSADAYAALQKNVDARVASAQAAINEERTRLAALMSELPHGVIVCNGDGQVLLYNQQAQELINNNSGSKQNAQGLLGLGRSIFGILDRDQIAHGLEMLNRCHATGHSKLINNSMMTLRNGACLRVNMAPFFLEQEEKHLISGFVLTLEDMTRQIEADSRRDILIQSLIDEQQKDLEEIRSSITSILAKPQHDPEQLQEYRRVIDRASRALQEKVVEARANYALHLHALSKTENVLAENLLEVISQNISERFDLQIINLAPQGIWLEIDSYSMVQAFSHLAGQLSKHSSLKDVVLTLTINEQQQIEIVISWPGQHADPRLLTNWQQTPLIADTNGKLLSFTDTIEKASGAIDILLDHEKQACGILITLPPVDQECRLAVQSDIEHRPISYEFDLFNRGEEWEELGQTPLRKLTYVVFDTETTGLNPTQGDEIIQLGAIRIVNGNILYREIIDQLIDPQRTVPAESVAIHGIQPHLLKGQPTIDKVLPHFQKFSENSVLVAHNAAFDMRFLQIQEERSGITLTNPVLDTLLLSSIIHPNQGNHSLDDLAKRFNVTIVGRHTALGDSIVTAEVLLKLIPLLEAHEIYTLSDAIAASAQSQYAKVAY